MKSSFNSQSKKTQEEIVKEMLGAFLFGGNISDELKNELTKDEAAETKNSFESTAQYFKDMYDAMLKVGFDQQQAFVLLNSIVEGISQNFKN